MSLKAKLEAVIYAAEEPVTLAQLAALFAADALEWKAEQAAVSAEQAAEAADPLPLPDAELACLEPEQAAVPGEPAAEPVPETDPETSPDTSPDLGLETSPEAGSEPAAEGAADSELEAKRLTRERDREVRAILRPLLDELITECASDGRGVEIREIAGGFRMATKPECHDAVRLFVKSLKPALKLSLPALETLAVIAYKQPVTAPEVNEIRGVDSSGVFGSLLARKLIATAGRKQVIGRPILYKTTREFLLRFGLKDISELPSMEEFEKMAAIELDDTDSSTNGQSGMQNSPDSGPELDENANEDLAYETDSGASPETRPASETAAMAASHTTPAPMEPEPTAGSLAIEAASTPAEAAPAAPSPTEQAETETFPHER
jgi:segregation and condensation protein B